MYNLEPEKSTDTIAEDIREKLQAAYALNLCTVSVSQIIDYNDVNILEQEYETILNNLNLENMPKDEALLDILKCLLETVAFFRIQEGEKKLLEKEYQQKMKNAIWEVVPNLSVVVSGGGIVSMLGSLAMQVGIGYMNYRKNRNQYALEKEKKDWALQKSAMEQFEGLQQQLFVTAWRLADAYNFPDEFRLTERQIKQYNAILMDTDEIRKFERLESIKHKFAAYPPFWYYIGNTANSISNRKDLGLNNTEKNYFKEQAKKYFEYYIVCNKYNLLREDAIAAACNLEYANLLDPATESEKIEHLTDSAIEYTGNSWDIFQLCAFNYLKIGATDKAIRIMRILINENYNATTNAQLLSRLYVEKVLQKSNAEQALADYKLLASRVQKDYLFPLPQNTMNCSALQESFITAQKDILFTKYQMAMLEFYKKYSIRINKIIPLPNSKKWRTEIYSDNKREERLRQLALECSNKEVLMNYCLEISNISYGYQLLEILNEMFASVSTLNFLNRNLTHYNASDRLIQAIKAQILEKKKLINDIDQDIDILTETGWPGIQAVYQLASQEISFEKITGKFFNELVPLIRWYVNTLLNMSQITSAEINLLEFCRKENIKEPELLYAENKTEIENDKDVSYFSRELLDD